MKNNLNKNNKEIVKNNEKIMKNEIKIKIIKK